MSEPRDGRQLLISGDSHMSEPPDLWEKNLPLKFPDELGDGLDGTLAGYGPTVKRHKGASTVRLGPETF